MWTCEPGQTPGCKAKSREARSNRASAQSDVLSSCSLPFVGLHDLSIWNDTVVLCVEGSQLGVQPHSGLRDQGIEDAKVMTQVICDKIAKGTSTIRLTGPMPPVGTSEPL